MLKRCLENVKHSLSAKDMSYLVKRLNGKEGEI